MTQRNYKEGIKMYEQMQLFKNPFDDVNTGDQFYCEATNTTYTVVWMFTGFFNGCLLVRTHLDTNFSEVCDYAKQKSHNSAMEEIAGILRELDRQCPLKQIRKRKG